MFNDVTMTKGEVQAIRDGTLQEGFSEEVTCGLRPEDRSQRREDEGGKKRAPGQRKSK